MLYSNIIENIETFIPSGKGMVTDASIIPNIETFIPFGKEIENDGSINVNIEAVVKKRKADVSFINTQMPEWFKVLKADTKSFYINNSFEKRIDSCLQNLFKSLDNFKSYFEFIPSFIISGAFSDAISKILPLNPENLNVGATQDTSIFINFSLSDFNFYFEIYFDIENEILIDSVLNVFKDKKNMLSMGGSLENSLKKIKEYFKIPLFSEDYYPNYELSGSFVTETHF